MPRRAPKKHYKSIQKRLPGRTTDSQELLKKTTRKKPLLGAARAPPGALKRAGLVFDTDEWFAKNRVPPCPAADAPRRFKNLLRGLLLVMLFICMFLRFGLGKPRRTNRIVQLRNVVLDTVQRFVFQGRLPIGGAIGAKVIIFSYFL